MSLLEISNVSKTYGNKKNTCKALDNVTLDIEKGEFVAIVGTSGSGKTTLLNLISGIDRQFIGDIVFNNVNLKDLSDDALTVKRRKEISVIFQSFNLVSSLTVEENIKLCVELDHRKVIESEVVSILEELNLIDKRKAFIHELSGGQQQRVAIARTLLGRPSIILADEPTGNLDSENAQIIIEIFKNMVKVHQHTVMIVTHDEHIAAQADRIIRFKDGRIVNHEGSI